MLPINSLMQTKLTYLGCCSKATVFGMICSILMLLVQAMGAPQSVHFQCMVYVLHFVSLVSGRSLFLLACSGLVFVDAHSRFQADIVDRKWEDAGYFLSGALVLLDFLSVPALIVVRRVRNCCVHSRFYSLPSQCAVVLQPRW